jgi:hypothetical protein
MNEVHVSQQQLIHWFNAIRNLPDVERTRALDAFWSGQLDSKAWLVTELNKIVLNASNIYVFGGWIGVLANMLLNSSSYPVLKVRSIDLDSWCEPVADTLNKIHEMDDWRFKARTADMSTYDYEWEITPHIVINTSSEHVTQSVYDTWYDRIPVGSLIVVQGNDFFSCDEHVRCSHSLDEFNTMNRVNKPLYTGELKTDMYTRYMSIWIKR